MDDETDIGLVDTHAEGDGGDHDTRPARQEGLQPVFAQAGRQAGVIGVGGEAFLGQGGGQFLGAVARAAIDDAGRALLPLQDLDHGLGGGALAADEAQAEVRPVGGGDEFGGRVDMQG